MTPTSLFSLASRGMWAVYQPSRCLGPLWRAPHEYSGEARHTSLRLNYNKPSIDFRHLVFVTAVSACARRIFKHHGVQLIWTRHVSSWQRIRFSFIAAPEKQYSGSSVS
ncbi:hypothetical protein BV25DRAFT_1832696 [Artomyces pyxidatus]|uniref:Uncharacterized protein n=1 Tax=Artomyces pyxidatus TaxID=48021 RepID=A0ACB8SJH8_9AGAM|nr:hypothetical protein BV25DRAFT_1832696 [Artomyces pyxidatus]